MIGVLCGRSPFLLTIFLKAALQRMKSGTNACIAASNPALGFLLRICMPFLLCSSTAVTGGGKWNNWPPSKSWNGTSHRSRPQGGAAAADLTAAQCTHPAAGPCPGAAVQLRAGCKLQNGTAAGDQGWRREPGVGVKGEGTCSSTGLDRPAACLSCGLSYSLKCIAR
eukprot:1141013-Pelagomonas_calceolata.AAC.6